MHALIKAYGQLRAGQTRDEVIRLFGPPDSITPMYSKKPTAAPTGFSLKYRIGPVSALPNVNDILIAIYLDQNGVLNGAEPQNVPGLSSLRF
jgi:hypothetical protein